MAADEAFRVSFTPRVPVVECRLGSSVTTSATAARIVSLGGSEEP